jgi:hypothetical protein
MPKRRTLPIVFFTSFLTDQDKFMDWFLRAAQHNRSYGTIFWSAPFVGIADRGRAMHSNVRRAGAFSKCAFLFVALSVFWFGLHARLEAYKSAASSISDSKMSTEKHSAKVLKALDKQDSPGDEVDASIQGFCLWGFHSSVSPLPLRELARIELADPRRLDLAGVYSLHGPPATTL